MQATSAVALSTKIVQPIPPPESLPVLPLPCLASPSMPAPQSLHPPATPPVSQRTRSHGHVLQDQLTSRLPSSPFPLQSQARALPISYLQHFSLPSPSQSRSPIAGRTRGQTSKRHTALCSPYPSPKASSGATRRRQTHQHVGTLKYPSLDSHPYLFSPYTQSTQKDYHMHRKRKLKPKPY